MQYKSIYDQMTNSEREVAWYLKKLGIPWIYEKPVHIYDEKKRPRVWTPDFFLKQLSIYIEVCGSKEFDYNYRKKMYKENGYNVIFLHLYKEKNRWKHHFFHYLIRISQCRKKSLEEIYVHIV